MEQYGHKKVDLHLLPKPMTKIQAAGWLLAKGKI